MVLQFIRLNKERQFIGKGKTCKRYGFQYSISFSSIFHKEILKPLLDIQKKKSTKHVELYISIIANKV